jgi:hypothetical protein
MRGSYPLDPGSAARVPDELQKITGIGPRVATRLAHAGITGYRDLASLTPGQIAGTLAGFVGVCAERIASQDWIGQAQRLAADDAAEPEGHQKYATFHIELLIDADNTVRRTKARHYQTDAEDSWPGWDDQRLIAVIRDRASLDGPTPRLGQPQHLPTSLIGVHDLAPAEEGTCGSFRRVGQPTTVRMTLQIGPIDGADNGSVDFTAEVGARSLEDNVRHPLATASGIVTTNQPTSMELTGPPLPAGIHALEAVVVIYPHRHRPHDRPLCDHRINGALVHVGQPRCPATARALQ